VAKDIDFDEAISQFAENKIRKKRHFVKGWF